MLKLAEHILDSKAADFDPGKFVDHYETALVDLLKKKQAGIQPKEGPAPVPQARVVNLMDALRRSIESDQPRKPAATAAARRKPAGRKRA
jgi:DNA end-binding protein Ku